MNYRREMRMLAPLAGVILVLAGCAAEENTPPATEAGPLPTIAKGTPAPKSAAAPAPGAGTTCKTASTNPEVATAYRKDMTAVRPAHGAVATASPRATQQAC